MTQFLKDFQFYPRNIAKKRRFAIWVLIRRTGLSVPRPQGGTSSRKVSHEAWLFPGLMGGWVCTCAAKCDFLSPGGGGMADPEIIYFLKPYFNFFSAHGL